MTREWEFDPIDDAFGGLFREDALNDQDFEEVHICEYTLKLKTISRAYGHIYHATGAMRWEGGTYLAQVMHRCPELFANSSVLELGCGCAPLPSLMAYYLNAKTVIITDGNSDVLYHAQHNFERNKQAQNDTSTHYIFERVIWGDADDHRRLLGRVSSGVDWIIGADVVYNEDGTKALFKTVTSWMHCSPNAQLLLCFMVRGISEGQILKLAMRAGLVEKELPPELIPSDTTTTMRLKLFSRGKTWPNRCCMKCAAMAKVLVRQRDPLCEECLLTSVESRFRTLFKTKNAISPGDRVMLEGDISAESQCALYLLLLYRNPDPQRIRRNVTNFSLDIVQFRADNNDTAAEIAPIREILSSHEASAMEVRIHEQNLPQIDWKSFNSKWDSTVCADLIQMRKMRALVRYAQFRGCNVVVLTDSATKLAQQMLSASCKGLGYSANSRIDLFDRRYESAMGITIIRPIKDISTAELALYCHYKELRFIGEKPSVPISTLDTLSEQFVHLLQDSFPSGVSSMLKMASRLSSFDWASTALCRLCSEPLQSNDNDFCRHCHVHIMSKLNADDIERLLTHFEFDFR